MKNKISYKIKIVALFSLIIIIFGAYFYTNYNSIENKSRRTANNNILNWFYNGKSIEYQNPNTHRSTQSKEEYIHLRKIVSHLDDSWEFEYENLDIQEISYSDYVIDYTYYFKDAKKNQLKLFHEKYYYDLDLVDPVPLKSNITLIIDNDSKILDEKSLWDGDYDTYCIKNGNNEN